MTQEEEKDRMDDLEYKRHYARNFYHRLITKKEVSDGISSTQD